LGLKKRKKKAKDKVAEIAKLCEFWLPLLNEFALKADCQPYEHPWIPVEILRRITEIVDAD
jgi:hypothetical protein